MRRAKQFFICDDAPLPMCAMEDCTNPPLAVMATESVGLDLLPLAFACSLPHFKSVMWATRHLGRVRVIHVLEGMTEVSL